MITTKPNSSQCIRMALDAGITKPTEIIAWVKKQHKTDVKPSLVNNVKHHYSKTAVKSGTNGKPSTQAGRPPVAVAAAKDSQPTANSTSAQIFQFGVLAGAVGKDKLKSAANLFAEVGVDNIKKLVQAWETLGDKGCLALCDAL